MEPMVQFGKPRMPQEAPKDSEGETLPPAFQQAMKMADLGEQAKVQPMPPMTPQIPIMVQPTGPTISMSAQEIIAKLRSKQQYEEVLLPSRNILYGQYGLEVDKPIHVKPMTIEEEKILSTPRLVKSGQALNKIYEACILEDIPAVKLLAPDRIFLLFYIRGISYGPDYEVELKCPQCEQTFNEDINLNTLNIEFAPDGFTGESHAVLPSSGLNVWYRVSTGEDEINLSRTKEMMAKNFSNLGTDDSIIRKNVLMINRIEGITNKIEIDKIVNELGVKDSGFLRDKINFPEFGPDTNIFMTCPSCYHEWTLDLPIDAGFFFPRTKKVS
jgi:hypothetical protein